VGRDQVRPQVLGLHHPAGRGQVHPQVLGLHHPAGRGQVHPQAWENHHQAGRGQVLNQGRGGAREHGWTVLAKKIWAWIPN